MFIYYLSNLYLYSLTCTLGYNVQWFKKQIGHNIKWFKKIIKDRRGSSRLTWQFHITGDPKSFFNVTSSPIAHLQLKIGRWLTTMATGSSI